MFGKYKRGCIFDLSITNQKNQNQKHHEKSNYHHRPVHRHPCSYRIHSFSSLNISFMKKGRKPITDKKKPVTIFVRQSLINQLGIDNLKNKLNATIQHHQCNPQRETNQSVY